MVRNGKNKSKTLEKSKEILKKIFFFKSKKNLNFKNQKNLKNPKKYKKNPKQKSKTSIENQKRSKHKNSEKRLKNLTVFIFYFFIVFFCQKNRRRKKCHPLSFLIFGGRNSTRVFLSIPFQISGGVD